VRTLGAYGFRVEGLGQRAARWLVPQEPQAPLLSVERVRITAAMTPPLRSRVDDAEAELLLRSRGWLQARAGDSVVRFVVDRDLDDAALVHPYLAPAAALHCAWRGQETLHAGAVVIGSEAVLLLGAREAGKSTTLHHLAEREGIAVLADDLAVISRREPGADGGDRANGADARPLEVLAGPRSIDLRAAAEDRSEVGERVRDGERVRLQLGEAPARVPLRGWVLLEWGDRLDLEPIEAQTRLETLARSRSYYFLHGDPRGVLELAALPAYRLRRPRERSSLSGTASSLLGAFS
jgi:hypothetical protein